MSERTTGSHTSGQHVSGWAIGLALFAGCMMILAGLFGVIAGLAGIVENKFYVLGVKYVFEFDVTVWGWIHLLVGILVGVAGFFVFTGQPWARGVGMFCAGLHAVVNFMFLPYYPVWSMLIIALDVAVIWALAVYSKSAATG